MKINKGEPFAFELNWAFFAKYFRCLALFSCHQAQGRAGTGQGRVSPSSPEMSHVGSVLNEAHGYTAGGEAVTRSSRANCPEDPTHRWGRGLTGSCYWHRVRINSLWWFEEV